MHTQGQLIIQTAYSPSYLMSEKNLTDSLVRTLHQKKKDAVSCQLEREALYGTDVSEQDALKALLSEHELVIARVGDGSQVPTEHFIEIISRDFTIIPSAMMLSVDSRAILAETDGIQHLAEQAEDLVAVYGIPLTVIVIRHQADRETELAGLVGHCLRRGINAVVVTAAENGTEALADQVIRMIAEPRDFKLCCDSEMPLKQKIDTILHRLYGVTETLWSDEAQADLQSCASFNLPICVMNPIRTAKVTIHSVDCDAGGKVIRVHLKHKETPQAATAFTDYSLNDFVSVLASYSPVPGGGGASALIGAVGMALGNMIGSLTLQNPKYADVKEKMLTLKHQADQLQGELMDLIQQDAEVFAPLAAAYKLPTTTPEEKAAKALRMEQVLDDCCRVPLRIMGCCTKAIDLLEVFAEFGTVMAISDAGVGAVACLAALKGASLNVRINTKSMADREKAEKYNRESAELIEKYSEKAEALFDRINARFE